MDDAIGTVRPDDASLYTMRLKGDGLLVAPVVTEGVTRQVVYLPAGEWTDIWTGERHAGPATIEVYAPQDVIPVFVRAV